MRTLIKVPLYVMIETRKCEQVELQKKLHEAVNETLLSEEFYSKLHQEVEFTKYTLIRTFTEPSLAQELLKLS